MIVTVPPLPVPTTPPRTRAPEPFLVMTRTNPLTAPFSVSVLPLTVMMRLLPPRLIAPVFWVRFAVPVKTRFPPRAMALVIVALTEASSVPPLMLSVPAELPLPPKA